MSSDKKLESCRRAVRRSPHDGGLQIRLAQAALDANQLDEALAAAQAAVASPAHRQRAGLIAARAMLARHAYLDAENLADQMIADKVGAEAYNLRGEARGNLQRFDKALEDFRTAIRLDPANYVYRLNIGICLQMMGAPDQAIPVFRQVLELRPRETTATLRLADALIALANYGEAIRILDDFLKTNPKNAIAWTSMGVAKQFSGLLEQARTCYQKATALEPKLVEAHSNLGTVLQGLRELDLAEQSYQRALDINPQHQDAMAGMAMLMDWQGRYDEGLALISPWVERGSTHPELLVSWASLMRHNKRQEEAIEVLNTRLVKDLPSLSYQQRLSFHLGDMYNDLGQYDRAFAAYRRGNEQKRAKFDRAAHDQLIDRSIEYFSREKIQQNKLDQGGEGMIFIVGMPRSGTSLSEQILAAHPQVHACGELTYLFELVGQIQKSMPEPIDYPDVFDAVTLQQREEFSQRFMALVKRGSQEDRTRFTDKMPSNFLYLGLINMILPNARVIHISRDPLDVCLSCYFQNFSAPGMHFTFDLGDIACYYRGYRKIMKHMRDVIDIAFMELTYEDLVADTETQTRRMIDFAGLDWDPACLEFHRLGRTIVTASHAQVRQPIYKTSAGRHEKYKEWTTPLVDELGVLIAEPRP